MLSFSHTAKLLTAAAAAAAATPIFATQKTQDILESHFDSKQISFEVCPSLKSLYQQVA